MAALCFGFAFERNPIKFFSINEFPVGEIPNVVIPNLQLPLKTFKNTVQFSCGSLQKQKPLSGMLFRNLRSAGSSCADPSDALCT